MKENPHPQSTLTTTVNVINKPCKNDTMKEKQIKNLHTEAELLGIRSFPLVLLLVRQKSSDLERNLE